MGWGNGPKAGLGDCQRITHSQHMTAIRNIVILTGAGVSAESGIDTFRGAGGLWENHRVDTLCRVPAKKVERRG